jgi:phage shock protein PspC (stress-responsive transcriptional regulator)
MNKIITINLGGIKIDIEEDAYDVLRAYLREVKEHFTMNNEDQEVLEDIESRISEMLYQKMRGKRAFVSMAEVEEVIRVMGTPRDFEQEGDDLYDERGKQVKRLFRDPDQAILGGVCSGLSKYLDIDVTVVRILWLILFFAFGSGLFLYLILWVIVPQARTAADRLQMSGEVPNVRNITNTIRKEANQTYENIKKKF